ncbi:hypothetical protein PVK06_048989 [Gossypium arboreum]|uniref:Reverse transcriptase n=1 Tax=Gossypium arboreum TaxID=29729 RepID=A0ABR0MHZ2_GOSAR|nr:hypothetical protein PVK06_048989 [Gossypium arboreum]
MNSSANLIKDELKGTTDSAASVYNVVQQSYLLSGLQLNASKCELFVAGVSQKELALMTTCKRFKVGRLPVRILDRIQGWSTKHLGYASRLQLIKAVILSVQAY